MRSTLHYVNFTGVLQDAVVVCIDQAADFSSKHSKVFLVFVSTTIVPAGNCILDTSHKDYKCSFWIRTKPDNIYQHEWTFSILRLTIGLMNLFKGWYYSVIEQTYDLTVDMQSVQSSDMIIVLLTLLIWIRTWMSHFRSSCTVQLSYLYWCTISTLLLLIWMWSFLFVFFLKSIIISFVLVTFKSRQFCEHSVKIHDTYHGNPWLLVVICNEIVNMSNANMHTSPKSAHIR